MVTRHHNHSADVCDLPWGAHCCLFYESEKDLLKVLVRYFEQGLLANERCLWVTSETAGVKQAIEALKKSLPNLDSYLKRGRLEIFSRHEWYTIGGRFEYRRVLEQWIQRCNDAKAHGCDGLRVTGDVSWLTQALWKKFVAYEAGLQSTINKFRMRAVCTYPVTKCKPAEVIEVVKNHGCVMVKCSKRWKYIENSQTARVRRAKVKSPIVDRKRQEDELRRQKEQLRALAGYLESVREEERGRIARELHDEIAQALTAVKLSLETHMREQATPAASPLAQALAVINELIGKVRDLSLELRPAMLDDLGLLAALRWYFERYTSQCGVEVSFSQGGLERRRFDPAVETAAYRIIQEALVNVARHAGVGGVDVAVRADDRTVCIEVNDRGRGFEVERLPAIARTGLSEMRERAIILRGELRIESTPGRGTRLTAELPLRGAHDQAAHGS
jgi:signal transduction histidine kinase